MVVTGPQLNAKWTEGKQTTQLFESRKDWFQLEEALLNAPLSWPSALLMSALILTI